MSFSISQYLRSWGLYLRGFRWLWSRDRSRWERNGRILMNADRDEYVRQARHLITYKPGWGPLRFLPVYCSTYLASVVLGLGVVSISRLAAGTTLGRWIDWIFARFGQEDHCRNAGPPLWGAKSAWE